MSLRRATGILLWGAALAGCGTPSPATGLRGVLLPAALPRPDITLTATDGRPFSFARDTRGRVTLLYFGYTHCPDVCPVHLANIAAVLPKLTHEDHDRIQVVFVTTDPARDSIPLLRHWLDTFDPSFIGLTGPDSTIARFEDAVHVARAIRESTADSTGAYAVGHAAQVIAFTPDDSAHVVYPFGTRQDDWSHDLPRLLHGGWSLK